MFLLYWILRIIVGGIFIASAILKLVSVDLFELSLVDAGIEHEMLAQFLSRILIWAELVLGIQIIVGIYLRASIRLSIALTILFTLYLLVLMFSEEEITNCGCFGAYFELTPAQSLIKNFILLPVLGFLLIKSGREFRKKWIAITLSVLCMAGIFIYNPPYAFSGSVTMHNPPEMTTLVQLSKGNLDFTEDKMLIAFFSPHCKHCLNTAYKLKIAGDRSSIPPVHVFFLAAENDEDIRNFFRKSNSGFNYSVLTEEEFFSVTTAAPVLYLMESGVATRKWSGATFSVKELETAGKN